MDKLLDKIKGGMFGLAIGDAIGGTTEFLDQDTIFKKYGYVRDMLGGGVHRLKPGETTDDTAMMMAVAKGIIHKPNSPILEIGKEFIKWSDSMPKDIGVIVMNTLNAQYYMRDWFRAAKETHRLMKGKSAGNGTLMRCIPVALGYPDLKEMEEITKLQSKMTHYSALSTEACLIYNRTARRMLNGEGLKEALAKECVGTRYEENLSEIPMCDTSGFVVDTMRWVVYILSNNDDFESAVLIPTNMGGDSDTIAAIAGGLAGLEIGYEKLPTKWKEKILLRKTLHSLSESLHKLRLRKLS